MADLEEREPLTVDEALEALDVDDGHVHCFIQAPANEGQLVLLGADWPLDKVRAAFEQYGAEVAGEGALAMKHGVGSGLGHAAGPFFFATTPAWTDRQVERRKQAQL